MNEAKIDILVAITTTQVPYDQVMNKIRHFTNVKAALDFTDWLADHLDNIKRY